jgi:hypothetical protein
MLLAWSRLEVPDEEGLTFFLSPFMAKNSKPAPKMTFSPPQQTIQSSLLLKHQLGFHAERGVTQGDTMATICWVAVFDMILTWCDPENTSSDAAYIR